MDVKEFLEQIAHAQEDHDAVEEFRRLNATPASAFLGGLPEKEAALRGAWEKVEEIARRYGREVSPPTQMAVKTCADFEGPCCDECHRHLAGNHGPRTATFGRCEQSACSEESHVPVTFARVCCKKIAAATNACLDLAPPPGWPIEE